MPVKIITAPPWLCYRREADGQIIFIAFCRSKPERNFVVPLFFSVKIKAQNLTNKKLTVNSKPFFDVQSYRPTAMENKTICGPLRSSLEVYNVTKKNFKHILFTYFI